MNPDNSVETFEGVWDRLHEPVCHFVCSRLADPQDAEDVLQDVFARVYTRLETVRDPQRLESWVYQVARNRIIDEYRRRQPWADLSESLPAAEDDSEGLVEGLRPALDAALGALPEPYREALVWSDVQGVDQKVLAEHSGISLSGAKSRVQRARQKVKAELLACFDLDFDLHGQVIDARARCCCSFQ